MVLMLRLFASFAAALLALGTVLAAPSLAKELTPAEKEAFEAVIKDYLLKNPEIVQEALAALQKKQEEQARLARVKIIEDKNGPLFTSDASIAIGASDADITIVEFFDYNCGYCKRGLPDIEKIVASDKKVRIILRDFPILSKESQEAAIVAMAVKKQLEPTKYWKFHVALMSERGRIGKDEALAAAKDAGADIGKLEKQMADDSIRKNLTETMEIAQALDITGTPSYVLGDEVVVGAVGFDDLTTRIANLRKCQKSTCS
jgi:protein-disulfide isomerase